jgi:NADH-quinone oxidoreductase subunit C
MALAPAVTDLEQLKEKAEVAALLAWNADAIEGTKFDRNELTIWIKRDSILEACRFLRDHSQLKFNMLTDLTGLDWFPSEPRFEVVYHLLSIPRKTRLRLKVKLAGNDTRISSVISVWPSCNFYEREVFDLFGIQFEGHPYMKRIMMPEDWEGHPLRKDYPVEGYR